MLCCVNETQGFNWNFYFTKYKLRNYEIIYALFEIFLFKKFNLATYSFQRRQPFPSPISPKKIHNQQISAWQTHCTNSLPKNPCLPDRKEFECLVQDDEIRKRVSKLIITSIFSANQRGVCFNRARATQNPPSCWRKDDWPGWSIESLMSRVRSTVNRFL